MALIVNGGARKKVAIITGITGTYLIRESIIKDQLISKCPFGVIKSPKKTNEIFSQDFCPSL